MNNVTEVTARRAILDADGNLTLAAASLGMMRGELWQFVTRQPLLLTLLDDLRETMVDTAETLLNEALIAGKPWAICFALRTRKDRGYGKPAKKKRQPKRAEPEAPDLTRLNAEQLARFQRLHSIAGGDGDSNPEPAVCRRLDLADVRAALADCMGNLGYAALKLGVTREELVEHLTRRPALLNATGDAREEVVDHAESALRAALAEKKPWAIRFILKALGRSRGYCEYEDSCGLAAPSPLMGQMDLSRLNDEELAAWERLNEIASGITEAPCVVEPTPVPIAPIVKPSASACLNHSAPLADEPAVAFAAPVVKPAASDRSNDQGRRPVERADTSKTVETKIDEPKLAPEVVPPAADRMPEMAARPTAATTKIGQPNVPNSCEVNTADSGIWDRPEGSPLLRDRSVEPKRPDDAGKASEREADVRGPPA